ncbi:dethiobiotin synthase [Hydrogenimonas sp. SS33]|uniref:dethiobiotin synthase n=1 Tax=Hydrogenimonas leucolamina TaxID=2954236 RepID=UPI00336BC3CC
MPLKLFVTATNTDVGKTHTTLLLMEEAAKRGLRPLAFKPVETGVSGGMAPDGSRLLEAAKRLNPDAAPLRLEQIVPYRFELPAAPFVAKGRTHISLNKIEAAMESLLPLCDILFVEGAGGLMVPLEENLFIVDLPLRLKLPVLLVTPGRLGSINDTLLSLEALQRRCIEPTVAVNLKEGEKEAFESVTKPYYESVGFRYLRLPEEAPALLDRLGL